MIKDRLLHSYLPGNPLKTTRTLKPSIKSVSGGKRPFEEEEDKAFGKRVSRRGREKRDSEEVWLHNFVYLGGVVHGMRKLWRPYSQSYFWAEPPKIMLGQGVVSRT